MAHNKHDAHTRAAVGAAWSWREELRVAGAEALGTALLVSVGGAGTGGAVAAGCTVALLVQCLDHVSGAMFNPAVTLAALVWGRVAPARAALMAAAQLTGGVAGAAALRAALPGAGARALTLPAGGHAPWQAACAEAVAGACLALANCAAWDDRNRHLRDSWPLRIGAAVAALTHAAGGVSGGSINPARSFGPALVERCFTAHWVYWVGPLGGALAATALYVRVWRAAAARLTAPGPAST